MTAAVASTTTADDTKITLHQQTRPLIQMGVVAEAPRRRPYLVPVPDCEPPFDDELDPPMSHPTRRSATGATDGAAVVRPVPAVVPTPSGPVAGSRTVRAVAAGGVRSTVVAAAEGGRSAVSAAAEVPPWSSEPEIGVRRTAIEELPPVHRAAPVFARALVEVLSGQRPLAQLRMHCAPAIYAGLGRRRQSVPLCLPHLLTVRTCEPADGVAEVSAVFKRADRVRALAFRIQGVDGRWRITALQVG